MYTCGPLPAYSQRIIGGTPGQRSSASDSLPHTGARRNPRETLVDGLQGFTRRAEVLAYEQVPAYEDVSVSGPNRLSTHGDAGRRTRRSRAAQGDRPES